MYLFDQGEETMQRQCQVGRELESPFGTLTKSTFFTQQFDYLQRSPDSPGGLSFRQMRAWEFIFTIEIHF